MLCMDFVRLARLRASMEDDDRENLASRVFAVLTAKLEDGAAEAATGQGQGKDSRSMKQLANRLQCVGEEIALMAEALRYLV